MTTLNSILRLTTTIVSVMLLMGNVVVVTGLVVPVSKTAAPGFATSTTLCYAKQKDHMVSADDMRQEIEEMRQEAIKRLDALNEKFVQVEKEIASKKESSEDDIMDPTKAAVVQEDSTPELSKSDLELLGLKAQGATSLERKEQFLTSEESAPVNQLKLIDNTRWRLSLNIGRERGTWMPKDWGVSGERLYVNLEIEFSPEQLYEREEFLNGIAGTKVLKVVHNEANLAPNLKEGSKRTRVRNGGWRVAPGEGPMGTTVLRFYVELEEQVSHDGSDVYCPAGRVYCTCGYFPMKDRPSGSIVRDALQQEQNFLVARYEQLATENEQDQAIFSLDKLKRSKQMMDIRFQATELQKKVNEAAVRDPDRAILRFSRDQSVGLTREGGVCCKVQKGMAFEYHILGKFEIASMENREHTDYRDLLSP